MLAARWKPQYLPRIEQTVKWLRSTGITVVLIGPVPIYDLSLPRLIVMANRAHDPELIGRSWDHGIVALDEQMAALARRQGVAYISAIRDLCSGFKCAIYDGVGLPLLSDQEHFTKEGSVDFARRLRVMPDGILQSAGAAVASSTVE